MAFRALSLLGLFCSVIVTASPTPTTDYAVADIEERAFTGINLLRDPGFEDPSQKAWSFQYTGSSRRTGPAAASGTAYAQILFPQELDMAPWLRQEVTFNKTSKYTLLFDYAIARNLAPGTPQNCQLNVEVGFTDQTFQLPSGAQDKTYKTYSTTVMVSKTNTQYKTVSIALYCDNRPGLVVHFDNFRLYEGVPPAPSPSPVVRSIEE